MAGTFTYRDLRRRLLPENPYFQAELIKTRKRLGIPPTGFTQAVDELGEQVHRGVLGFPIGKPDLDQLRKKALRLGLPLGERLDEWTAMHAGRGTDFQQVIEKSGWAALPIFLPDEWGSWWVSKERAKNGLGPADDPMDLRLPAVAAAYYLVEKYRLGQDYLPHMASLLLGCPSGGGQADLVIEPLSDGSGITVTFDISYDCTANEWRRIYQSIIQPALLWDTGKIRGDVLGWKAVAEARRRVKSGRPIYNVDKLEADTKMWGFCYQHGFLIKITKRACYEFFGSLSDAEWSKFENLDLETFRRNVRALDRLMRPTKSAAHYSS